MVHGRCRAEGVSRRPLTYLVSFLQSRRDPRGKSGPAARPPPGPRTRNPGGRSARIPTGHVTRRHGEAQTPYRKRVARVTSVRRDEPGRSTWDQTPTQAGIRVRCDVDRRPIPRNTAREERQPCIDRSQPESWRSSPFPEPRPHRPRPPQENPPCSACTATTCDRGAISVPGVLSSSRKSTTSKSCS